MSWVSFKIAIRHVFFVQDMKTAQNDPAQPLLRSNSSIGSDLTDIEAQPGSHNSQSLKQSKQSNKSKIIADATLGLSDGLTVPFALTAGLSTLGNTKVVIYGGIAELIAGAISMGLGGYLSAISEA